MPDPLPPDARRGAAAVDVDPVARMLGERFAEAGHQLYVVGGVVRDGLLGRSRTTAADQAVRAPDLDLATDARPDETLRVLRDLADRRYLKGVEYGTVGAMKDGTELEITTFRQEVYRESDRKPVVTFSDDIETDLSRRDFTINAMAIRLPDGEFVDPYGGVKALAARVIDTPLDPEISFSDDPLRMLRAARFAAVLGFTVAPRVVEAMHEMRGRLAIVSAERISEELDKLLAADEPSRGLELIVQTGLADGFLPELSALELEQDPVHKHKDVLAHTYAVVEKCEPDRVLRLAALLHDIGKPKTRQITADGVQFHHHEVVGARMAEERLKALRYPASVVSDVRALVEMHLRFHTYRMGWTDGAVRRYVRDAGPLLDRLNQLTRADCTTQNRFKAKQFATLQDELEERIARLAEAEALDAIRPPLDGIQVMEHLGVEPGREVGRALDYLLDVRMERGPIPEAEAFALLDAWWAETRGQG